MSWPEVQDLPARTDVVNIALGALEQHGPQLPAGTDYLSAVETREADRTKDGGACGPILAAGTLSVSHGVPRDHLVIARDAPASLSRGRTESRSARIPAHSLPE